MGLIEVSKLLDDVLQVEERALRAGKRLIANLARFVAENGYTQVLTPSHLIRSTADDWWDIDLRCASELREELDRLGCGRVSVLCSLPITYAMLRNPAERRALIQGLKNSPAEGLWLAVDGVGSASTPTAVRSYLEAAATFHALRIPVIADHAGGLVGLAFVAFGGVGALAHGVTHGERFDTGHWRRPRGEVSFGMSPRVYLPALDMHLKPAEARSLFDFGRRATGLFGCRDSQLALELRVRRIAHEDVLRWTSHPVDGVCPLGYLTI